MPSVTAVAIAMLRVMIAFLLGEGHRRQGRADRRRLGRRDRGPDGRSHSARSLPALGAAPGLRLGLRLAPAASLRPGARREVALRARVAPARAPAGGALRTRVRPPVAPCLPVAPARVLAPRGQLALDRPRAHAGGRARPLLGGSAGQAHGSRVGGGGPGPRRRGIPVEHSSGEQARSEQPETRSRRRGRDCCGALRHLAAIVCKTLCAGWIDQSSTKGRRR